MAATVRETVRELLDSTRDTLDYLLSLPLEELHLPSSHPCAQGGALWNLLTNDIDHETIHAGQVLEARSETRATASALERIAGEWLEGRVRFIRTFAGLSDETFNSESAPGEWTYRAIAKHILDLERHSLMTIRDDIAARA
jgi:uncharacterized damage-inducible protein DinB